MWVIVLGVLVPLPLTSSEVQELYGALGRVLSGCPATQMRIIAGDAGWDRGLIPDGIDEDGYGTRRLPIESAIDGQWAQWDDETKARRARRLAQALLDYFEPRGMEDRVNNAITHCGYNFVNGDFVPVDAAGCIPE